MKESILKIDWQDSGSYDNQWTDIDDVEYPKAIQTTVGFLIKENKDWIILANTYDREHNNITGIFKIYKKCIINKETLDL